MTVPGMVRISLDPEGRPRTFPALPKAADKGRAEPFDLATLFRLADGGLVCLAGHSLFDYTGGADAVRFSDRDGRSKSVIR